MQIEKKVFSKLFKKEPTALAKKKIALTVADDLDLAINMIKPLIKEGEDFSKNLRDLGKKIADLNTDIEGLLTMSSAFIGLGYIATDQVDEALKKAEDAADSLGLEPSFIPGYSDLKGLADVDYFSIKGVEDAYYEAVKYEAGRLMDTVNNSF